MIGESILCLHSESVSNHFGSQEKEKLVTRIGSEGKVSILVDKKVLPMYMCQGISLVLNKARRNTHTHTHTNTHTHTHTHWYQWELRKITTKPTPSRRKQNGEYALVKWWGDLPLKYCYDSIIDTSSDFILDQSFNGVPIFTKTLKHM